MFKDWKNQINDPIILHGASFYVAYYLRFGLLFNNSLVIKRWI